MNIDLRTASLTQARAYLAQLIYDIAPGWTLHPVGSSTPQITDDIPADATSFHYSVHSGERISCHAIPSWCAMTYSTAPPFCGVDAPLTGHHDTDLRIIVHVTKIQQLITKAGA